MAATSKTSSKKGSKAAGAKKGEGGKTRRVAKRRKPSKKKPLSGFVSRFWLAALAFSVGLTAITLVWALNLTPPTPFSVMLDEAAHEEKTTPAMRKASPVKPAPVATVAPAAPSGQMRAKIASQPVAPLRTPVSSGRVYEVYDADLLEQKIKEIDLALVQTIMALDLDPRQVRHLDIAVKSKGGQKYHTQSLAISLDQGTHGFVDVLRENLGQWVDGAKIQAMRKDPLRQEWRISLLDLPTHTVFLEFNGHKAEPASPSKQLPGTGPRLVVVIDDLGESLHQARELAALNFPVTFAVLPQSSKTREVARLASPRGKDVLLHHPMEPRDYPHRADPGPGALFVGMAEEDVLTVLAENLAQVPQAIGVNNHMGSRFTADSAGMEVVLHDLKQRGLFFLDSLTTGDSVVQKQARKIGLTHLRRHIFLDNVQDVQAILFQLRKAETLALSAGEVIAIGHPYPETLEALKIWERERDQRIRLVSVSDILPGPALASAP